jgi:hypothetical protein
MDTTKVLRYLLPEPPRDTSAQTLAGFTRLWGQALASPGIQLDYDLPAPKWQFLSWLAETQPVVLHGSSRKDIPVVEPRQADDVREFSAQAAIYAATDGIWTIFFAILNRGQIPMAIFNSAVRIHPPGQPPTSPYFFFSINREAFERGPFCDGMVYVLPRAGFEQDPMRDFGGIEISVPHWAGKQAALPLARLAVSPVDFPFLAQIRTHDHDELRARIQADPNGFPWVEENNG